MAYKPEYGIDLDKIVRERTDKIPQFVINILKKVIHQDFINANLTRGYEGKEFVDTTVEYLDVHPILKGIQNLDLKPGVKYTFVSNHPLGGIDGIILSSRIWGLLPEGSNLKLQVNDFLMAIPGLKKCCLPISKVGAQSRDLPQLINAQYSGDDPIMVFPAGMCSRKIDGKVQDPAWSKTFIAKSVENGRTIVPIHFKGENSKRFYRVATLCKKLGIKFNLAMLLLPDEMYRGQHKTFEIVFGKPFEPSFFDSSRSPLKWAAYVRDYVYSLD